MEVRWEGKILRNSMHSTKLGHRSDLHMVSNLGPFSYSLSSIDPFTAEPCAQAPT